MAIENVTPDPAEQAGQTLQPHEYLHWLLGLEQRVGGLPPDTRAYLVAIDPDTHIRRLTPVGAGDSVINLEADLPGLIRTDSLLSTEFLQEVIEACAERLARRGIKAAPSEGEKGSAKVMLVDADEDVSRHGRQVRAIASAIRALLPNDPFRHPLLRVSQASVAVDRQKCELRDSIIAAREFANTLDHIGCALVDSVPDRINEAMKVLGLGRLPSFQVEGQTNE